MRLTNVHLLLAVSAAKAAKGAYVPSDPWTDLTPSKTLAGATTDFSGSFAISLETIASLAISDDSAEASASATGVAKRDVTQIGDGQVQANSATVSTIAAESTVAAESVVNQITDGQIQAQSAAATTATAASVVNQITDGQIQAQSAAPTTAAAAAASVVNQISDGQIQAQSAAATTAAAASVVNQITDGQIQAQSSAAATAASVANQITDGQVQAESAATTTSPTTAAAASQISDGQIQASSVAAASQVTDGQVQSEASSSSDSDYPETCVSSNALTVTLEGGILKDAKGRIGAIVANRQFQFDGPPPQAGSIYAAGWGIKDGSLAIGDTTTFYKCKSGDFSNLYDQYIGTQCVPVHIKVLKVVSC
ncbi:uncharacterized protein PRCAT00004966001 [Priceomyces carsonii]|uniref:uncharacterized protein n=1 Tax=Priceomyces carsonii TaxID=28549 RepID=UPI002ED9F26C|nr:unnamed protein product [Priceomyces carsonii]